MKKLKAVIIDDEKLGRDIVKTYLKEFDDIEIAAECKNGFEGVKSINDINPDIIFLDIQMPKINGFEMLELLDHPPAVIFTTAYDQYAIKAFEKNAVDYLLKPFSAERFAQAVNKAKNQLKNKSLTPSENLTENYHTEEFLNRIVVKHNNNIIVLSTEEIIAIEAQDDYVMLHTAKGKYLKKKTMSYYEKNLDPKNFIRIHRSAIINISHLDKIELTGKEQYIAKMKNGIVFSISRGGYAKLKELLS